MQKISGGYYLKARVIQEKKISKAPPHIREIWDYLLMNANHKDNKYGGFQIKRGQLFRTYQDIREGLCWYAGYRKMMYNENHTKKAMKFLRDNQMIATTKELGGVLITVLNYDFYQNPKNYEGTNERTNERTIEEPMENQGGTDNNKNDKNDKNIYSSNFEKFWKEYPNKIAKKKAFEIWKKISKTKQLPSIEIILKAIELQKEWRRNSNGEFRPEWKHPTTWLNQGCWEDELDIKEKKHFTEPLEETPTPDYLKDLVSNIGNKI